MPDPKPGDCYRKGSIERVGEMQLKRKTGWEIAVGWYDEEAIARCIQQRSVEKSSVDKIPEDVYSPEFAKWLTHQYRLAMAKGVQLGRDGSEDQSDG